MSLADVSRIKLDLVPMIQETIAQWHIVHFLVTTPTESPAIDDFSSQLSSLQIDGSIDKRSLNEKLGKCDFTLGFILFVRVLSLQSSTKEQASLSSICLPNPSSVLTLVRELTSWIVWGRTGQESSVFFIQPIDLAFIFLRYGQYDAIQYILTLVDVYSWKEKVCDSIQSVDGEWSVILHLLGCCLVAQAECGLHGSLRDRKVSEAIPCFYRAASIQGALDALQSLPYEAGWARLSFTGCSSTASWKLRYYQWAMQIFEQYSMSERSMMADPRGDPATAVKGRLWVNVFKFALDLNRYHEAYCSIISNLDEESKNICLRRFIIVLYERGAIKILCNGQLPFICLAEKVEQELAWKAERSDVSSKPNPFKLLCAFEMHRHNWRKAARFIYMYSSRLRIEMTTKDHQHRSLALQERLNGLSAAINALQLIHPAYAWIDSPYEGSTFNKDGYPSKKARITMHEQTPHDDGPPKQQSCLEIEKLENEYILTSAEYRPSLENITWTFTGFDKPPSNSVDLLVDSNQEQQDQDQPGRAESSQSGSNEVPAPAGGGNDNNEDAGGGNDNEEEEILPPGVLNYTFDNHRTIEIHEVLEDGATRKIGEMYVEGRHVYHYTCEGYYSFVVKLREAHRQEFEGRIDGDMTHVLWPWIDDETLYKGPGDEDLDPREIDWIDFKYRLVRVLTRRIENGYYIIPEHEVALDRGSTVWIRVRVMMERSQGKESYG